MSENILKIGHLDENKPSTRCQIKSLVVPIPNMDGFVFGVIDVRGAVNGANVIFERLEEIMNDQADGSQAEGNLEREFEKMLATMNESLQEASEDARWPITPEDVNAVIGMVAGSQMYLSGAGDMVGVYLHRKDKTRYKVFNLFRGIQTEQAVTSWEKIFSVVLDGDLHAGDIFLCGNRELTKEVSKEDMMEIVSTLPPSGAVVKLRQYFPLKTDFGAIVMKVDGKLKVVDVADEQAVASVDKLGRVSASTQKVLEDQKPDITRLAAIMSLLASLGKLLFSALMIVLGITWDMVKFFGKTTRALVRSDRKETLLLTKSKADKSIHRLLSGFNRLPKTSKYILLAVLMIICVFAVSIFFISKAKTKERAAQEFNTAIQVIEEKRDAAMASIIYQDEDQARALLLEADQLLSNFQTEDPTRLERIAGLRADLEQALSDLRHLETIDQPEVVADLRSVEAEAGALDIEITSDNLYLFADNGAAYKVDPVSKTIELFEGGTVSGQAVASGYDDTNDVVYFLDSQPGISRLDPEAGTLEEVVAGAVNESVTDIEVYARRIYAVSPAEDQIIRYDRSGTGFGAGTSWILNKSTSLTDAVSISVDGDIYVLKGDGSFARFSGGEEIGWNLGVIDPALTGNGSIWTTDTSKYLYVLEPGSGRLIVIEKESGSLVVQYQSSNFTDLKDFVIDEANRLIYILSGTQVLKINASYL